MMILKQSSFLQISKFRYWEWKWKNVGHCIHSSNKMKVPVESRKHQNCNDLFLGPLSTFEENFIKTILHLFKLFCLFYRQASTSCHIKSSLGGGKKKSKNQRGHRSQCGTQHTLCMQKPDSWCQTPQC